MPPPSSPEPLTGLAPAKVNLTLRITGRRSDGYHLLDSLVVFAGIGDRLSVRQADDLSLSVSGPFAEGVPDGPGNLVLRAAALLRERRGVPGGAALELEKHLPHGGGIGGGSSDAACAIHLLSRLWGVPPLSAAEAVELGADVPVCLHAPAAVRMTGIGDTLSPFRVKPGLGLVLVSPGVHVPTPQAFAAYARGGASFSAPLDPPPDETDAEALGVLVRRGGNDLAAPAIRLAPEIRDVLDALSRATGILASGMSGSGSVCWGLAADREAAGRAAAELGRAGWWVRAAPVLS